MHLHELVCSSLKIIISLSSSQEELCSACSLFTPRKCRYSYIHYISNTFMYSPTSTGPTGCSGFGGYSMRVTSHVEVCRAQVQVQVRSGEGQVKVRWGSGRSDSGKVQLKEIKTQRSASELYHIFGLHPPTQTFFFAFKGSRQVEWT